MAPSERACPRGFARKRGTQLSRDVARNAQRSAGQSPRIKSSPKAGFYNSLRCVYLSGDLVSCPAIRLGKPAFVMVGGEGLETTYSGMLVSGYSGWCSYSLDNLVRVCLMDAKPYDMRRRAAQEVSKGSVAMSKPDTDFNSMMLGAA